MNPLQTPRPCIYPLLQQTPGACVLLTAGPVSSSLSIHSWPDVSDPESWPQLLHQLAQRLSHTHLLYTRALLQIARREKKGLNCFPVFTPPLNATFFSETSLSHTFLSRHSTWPLPSHEIDGIPICQPQRPSPRWGERKLWAEKQMSECSGP